MRVQGGEGICLEGVGYAAAESFEVVHVDGEGRGGGREVEEVLADGGELVAGEGVKEGDVGGDAVEVRGKVAAALVVEVGLGLVVDPESEDEGRG